MATRLKATTAVKYGRYGETAQPGEIFELDEARYADSITQLIESGDAELVTTSKATTKPDANA